ncbi:putative Resolvase [Magnetospirillum sp. XM-1]|uniref:recombinase family protein n=1 Tax=Magnetospirillum sp. XM-1 TaxID=1663591 RepID=UPI00073DBBD2|nr:recombinase family protein [Magnetospirillum sp. XM-1]CUW37265.1 putative Resolvase [Magnetospirillum sp. XM-1]
MKRVALYARVSTDFQTVENQLQELHRIANRMEWEVVAEFTDQGISGSKGRDQRPGFDRLLKGVARHEFDLVAAWAVDRLGRSLRDLVLFMDDLREQRVDLFLAQQGLDTSTASGKAMFGMLSVFSDFERSLITARVKSGLQRVRSSGVRLGRPPTDPAKIEKAKGLLAAGTSLRQTAKLAKISPAMAAKIKAQMGEVAAVPADSAAKIPSV